MISTCPSSICTGDRVAVIAPAGPVELGAMRAGVKWLQKRYQFIENDLYLDPEGYLAGTDERRLEEFQKAIDDPAVRALFAARGGYGTTRIIDRLDLNPLKKKPKWVVGSSDLTGVLVTLYAQHRVLSVHGPMVASFGDTHPEDLQVLSNILEGNPWVPPTDLKSLRPGEARGPIVGGNLTLLAHLAGTISPEFMGGAIVFLEDVGEKPYRIDRCLVQLKRSGFLEGVVGIVVGEFTECQPGLDGVTAEQVIVEHTAALNIPVATHYPAAHGRRNYPFIHGAEVALTVTKNSATLSSSVQ